jgi:hypothetical protein
MIAKVKMRCVNFIILLQSFFTRLKVHQKFQMILRPRWSFQQKVLLGTLFISLMRALVGDQGQIAFVEK